MNPEKSYASSIESLSLWKDVEYEFCDITESHSSLHSLPCGEPAVFPLSERKHIVGVRRESEDMQPSIDNNKE